jgi:benzoylformate decarboxylase
MASQVTKWSTEVLNASDIPIAIQRAFKMAIQPPTGPVFISLPQDVLDQSLDFEYIPDMQVYTQLRPDQNAIVKAAELLAKAVTPTIIVETGVARNDALFEVVRLAELTGARVYQPWMSDVNFPVSHPQYMGDLDLNSPKGKDILQTVDVLIVVGCQLFGVTPILSRNIQVIQIDDDPKEIAKNFPVTVGIQGNIKSSLIELTDILQKNMSMNEKKSAFTRVENIAKEKEEISITLREKADQERDNVPISISRLMHDLKNSLEPETLIVDDCWSSSATLRCTLDLNKSCSYYRARGGSIGWGLSGAIGVKLGAPNHPVVALCGDGSAMWSIQSLWTAAHYNIHVTYIVIANRSYRQVKIMRKMLIGGKLNERHAGMDLDEPAIDFCQLAQAMGIKGKSVDKPENLKKALKLALGSNQPRLVEVQVENTP